MRGYEPFLNLYDSNSGNYHRIQSAHGDLNFFSAGPIYNLDGSKTWIPRMVIRDSGNVGIGTIYPNHQLSLGRGPTWTRNGWGGSMELENASAIGWKTNAAGYRFGIGHTNDRCLSHSTALAVDQKDSNLMTWRENVPRFPRLM